MRGMRSLVCGLLLGIVGGGQLAAQQPAAQQPAAQQPAAQPDDASHRLAATEIVSGYHVYLVHSYIALVVEKYDAGQIDGAKTRTVLGELITICNLHAKALQPVRNGKVSNIDREYLDQVLAICELLQKQAQAISDLTQTKAEVDRQKFHTARTESWAKIKVLLNIPDPQSQPVNTTAPATSATPTALPPAAPPVATPPVAAPPAATPPVAAPPAATPPVATPPVATPPVATPPVATPPAESPVSTRSKAPPAETTPPRLIKSNPPPPSVLGDLSVPAPPKPPAPKKSSSPKR